MDGPTGPVQLSCQPQSAQAPQEAAMGSDVSDDEHGSNDSVYPCPFKGCKKIFSRRMRLNSHMHMHNGTQPYKCEHPGCGKAFSEKQNLRIHMRIHRDERPFQCSVPGCGKSFRTKGNMQDHERRHTNSK